mmetsp:Transcript_13246/g.16824  ORF Transcript_13246/g.16824 Transcript_13246/m.16824 type:complete len:157 (-) Transcript_13246:126-596(-)
MFAWSKSGSASAFARPVTTVRHFSSPIEGLSTLEKLKIKMTPWVWDRKHLTPGSLPTVAQRKPFRVELEPGKEYMWCTCGLSKTQPFCDMSHVKTLGDFKPLKFVWDGPKQTVSLCGCKLNKDESGARCDGSHRRIDFDDMSKYKPNFTRTKEWLS